MKLAAVIASSGASVFALKLFFLSGATLAVESKKAIRPKDDISDLIEKFDSLHIESGETNGPPCTLDLQKDLPKPNQPQPLYIKPKTQEFWLPNAKGQLEIPMGATIELHCSKSFANVTQSAIPRHTRILAVQCLRHNIFQWRGRQYEFGSLQCTQPASYAVRSTSEKCDNGRAKIYVVGFNISSGSFAETLRMCHDDLAVRALYVQYTLRPANVHFQRNVKRLNFSQAGYFKELNMHRLYTQASQQQQAAQLGSSLQESFFDNRTLYLSRGHLAAKSDLIFANHQRSTFNFFNVAPQWQSFNGGQWATLEEEVRKFVARLQIEVDCFTGTWGTLRLGGHPFYLAYDENNNGLLPVPELFYRVLVEHQHMHSGIALIGVNNPHATLKDIREHFVICEDIHEQVKWLKWIRNRSLKKGFIYACYVDEFAKRIGHLPAYLRHVTQLLNG